MSRLYSPAILAAAVELADYPALADFDGEGTARSQTCGSHMTVQLALDDYARVSHLGMRVHACAIGQAAAALFARHARGQSGSDIAAHLHRIEAWLRGEAEQPDWPDIALIAPALAYPARHSAMRLPWMAACEALSSVPASR